jgi:hypothetical protein
MKNANYKLVKMLLAKLDDTWRLEQHYAKDAKELGCKGCQEILKKILRSDAEHADMLRRELSKHMKDNMFD